IRNKHALELAAGLGLAGLFAASLAKQIVITDKEPVAEIFVKQSAQHLGLTNATAKTMNWNDATKEPLPTVVLLIDVNYEPAVFAALKQVLQFFLDQKVPVIISTPQRLVAKAFISSLLPYCMQQENYTIGLDEKETEVSVFVLSGQ